MFRPTSAMMSFSTKSISFCITRSSVCTMNRQNIITILRKQHEVTDSLRWKRTYHAIPVVACTPEHHKNIQTFGCEVPYRAVYQTSPSLQLRMFHTSMVAYHKPNRNCWNCGRDTSPVSELFFCDCGVVQKPATELTYFDLMQLEPSFDIDVKNLGDMFRETQMKLHPDKFSTKSEEERELAQHQSSLLNKAYNTLQKPLSRAIYMLELHNIEISEQDNFSHPEFLMEIMEINEQISNAKKLSDVESLEVKNNDRISECIKEISKLFQKNLLNDVKNTTIKLRYYTTIQERINELRRNSLDDNMRQ